MGYVARGIVLNQHFRGNSRFEMKIMITININSVGISIGRCDNAKVTSL